MLGCPHRAGEEEKEKILQLLNRSLALRLLKNLQTVVPISPFFREVSVSLPIREQQARNGVTSAPPPKAKGLGWAAKKESRANPSHTYYGVVSSAEG